LDCCSGELYTVSTGHFKTPQPRHCERSEAISQAISDATTLKDCFVGTNREASSQ
jgi:hypothetical protein